MINTLGLSIQLNQNGSRFPKHMSSPIRNVNIAPRERNKISYARVTIIWKYHGSLQIFEFAFKPHSGFISQKFAEKMRGLVCLKRS